MTHTFPKHGSSRDQVLERMRGMAGEDADWRGGKTWSLVYYGGDELAETLKAAYNEFFCTNGLSPFAFPSLRRFEHEVVAMTTEMLGGGPGAVGTMTSGGTESILMAIKAARDKGRAERGIEKPEMVLPITAHPAFEKAAHYFQVEPKHIPIADDLRADVAAAAELITDNTVVVVGSAPGYPHGVIDPIEELAALAQARGVPCHVDACLGGFLLPWMRKLGHDLPAWDFSVPGVTSISADLHKYGYAARGASTVTYRDESYRRYQFFAYTDWPGGLYASPSMIGSRAGGAIAAAWAALHFLGEEGYLALTRQVMETTRELQEGITAIEGLRILGEPAASIFAFTADEADVYAVAEAMKERGWGLDAQHLPPSLHLMVTPTHAAVVEPFLRDLAGAVERAHAADDGSRAGIAAVYGMAGAMTDRTPVRGLLIDLLAQLLPGRA